MSINQPTPSPTPSPTDGVNSFVKENPQFVQQHPTIAAAALTSNDPNAANTLAATATAAATVKAVQDHIATHNSQSWWQHALGDALQWEQNIVNFLPGASTLANWASKPDQEVQKDYKFLSSVYEKHGPVEGVLATLPVVAGAVIGSRLGPEGTIGGSEAGVATATGEAAITRLAAAAVRRLGAAAGGFISRNVLGNSIPNFKQSVNDSNNPNYIADMGRQVAHGLANIPGFASLKDTTSGAGQIVSGVTDAAFDFKTDPLLNLGKLKAAIKGGGYLAQKLAEDGKTPAVDDAGKPIFAPSYKIAARSDAVDNFMLTQSGKLVTADQLDKIYSPITATTKLGQAAQRFGQIVNPMANSQVSRAIDKIAGMDNPAEIKKIFPQFTDQMAVELAKTKTAGEVLGKFGEALYSNEFAAKGAFNTSLTLPSLSLGKNFAGDLLENIRKNSQASTLAETANFLLPKRVARLDETGGRAIRLEDNSLQKPGVTVKDENGKTQYDWVKPALVGGGFMNALAGKVRTFTSQKAMAFSPTLLKYSTKSIDWKDPDASNAVRETLMSSMTYKTALEHTAAIMAEPLDEMKSTMFHRAQMEAINAAGLPADTATFNKIVAEGKRATLNEAQKSGIWGFDDKGNPITHTEMKPFGGSSDPARQEPYKASTGLFEHHAAGTAMIDYKAMRQAMRATKAYGALYNKFDDGASFFTNVLFAPLVLLNTAFGARVGFGEAMHQVIRRGMGDYLQNRIAATAAGRAFEKDAMLKRTQEKANREAAAAGVKAEDKTAELPKEVITPADHAGIASAVSMQLTENELDHLKKLANNTVTDDTLKTNDIVKRAKDMEKQSQSITQKAIDLGVQPGRLGDAIDDLNLPQYKTRLNPVGMAALKGYKIYPYSLKDKIDVLSEKWIAQGWKGNDAGIDATHTSRGQIAADELAHAVVQRRGKGSKPGEEIAGLSKTDPHYTKYHAVNLTQMAHSEIAQSIAKDFLKGQTAADLNKLTPDEQWAKVIESQTNRLKDPNQFQKARSIINSLDHGVPESVAANQVKSVRGLVTGSDGTIHTDLIKNIANGRETYAEDLKNIPQESLPSNVVGRKFQPSPTNVMQRIEDGLYRATVNPVMNWVSRDPLYAHFYYENYIKFRPLIDMGRIDKETAQHIASLNAVKEMTPLIHSPQIRSQFAMMHRNVLPFFFAQEQAMKRAGRLILSNPQALRDFQMIHQGLNNPAFVHTDSTGQKHIVYPMIGEAGSSFVRAMQAWGININSGLPENVTGNITSLNTVLPDIKLPSFGMFTSIALQDLANIFPWMQHAVDFSRGGFKTPSMLDTIMPNTTVRDLFTALNYDQRNTVVANAQVSAMMAAYYHGDMNVVDGSGKTVTWSQLNGSQRAALQDRAENNAKTNLFIKGLLSFFLPLSPSVNSDYMTKDGLSLNQEWMKMVLPKSSGGQGLTHLEAWPKFAAEHGDQAVSYTAMHTVSGVNGAKIPLSDTSIKWLDSHKDWMTQYPAAAAYLIPQGQNGPDALKVDQKLLTMHLRSQATPEQFLKNVYIQKGWNDLQPYYDDYKATVAAHQNAPSLVAKDVKQWKTFSDSYGLQNPVWHEDYNSKLGNESAHLALDQLNTMRQKGLLNSPEYSKINFLLDNTNNFIAAANQQIFAGRATKEHGRMVTQFLNSMTQWAKDDSTVTSIINGVFKRVAA